MVSSDRVRAHTGDEVQAEIDHETQRRVESLHGASTEVLTGRLDDLRREWNVRAGPGGQRVDPHPRLVDRGRSADPQQGFRRAGRGGGLPPSARTAGLVPPLPVLRRLGLRTQREIDAERTAVRLLRGDLQRPSDVPPA